MLVAYTGSGCDAKNTELRVFAAASLQNALLELNELYMQKNTHIRIVSNFAGSGALQQGIENSPGSCDVFVSAAAAQMDNLQDKGLLLDDTRKNILNNKVVLIVPINSTLNITSFDDLAKASVRTIAIGNPASVPAGAYAQEILKLLGIFGNISAEFNYGSSATQVLQWVESGNADAGIVFSTDALSSAKVKIVAEAPYEINAKVVYPVAIIKECKNVAAAQEYIEFLFSNEAKAIFEKYGFAVVAK